ncbi:AlpA family transcriptional regulator [Pseudomonas sp. 18173]|uniref:AlpA family transcriptional regulator n=1 Tax=Pseudomonas sp. 18173 TaxID=3390055 RepID=UPI003D227985
MSKSRRILRLPEVMYLTGYKRTAIYDLMERGEFPQCCHLGLRAIGWDSAEIDDWIDARLNARHKEPSALNPG